MFDTHVWTENSITQTNHRPDAFKCKWITNLEYFWICGSKWSFQTAIIWHQKKWVHIAHYFSGKFNSSFLEIFSRLPAMDKCILAKLKSISCRDSLEKCFGLLFGFYIFFTAGLKNRPTWMTHMCGWRSHSRSSCLRHLGVSKKQTLGSWNYIIPCGPFLTAYIYHKIKYGPFCTSL